MWLQVCMKINSQLVSMAVMYCTSYLHSALSAGQLKNEHSPFTVAWHPFSVFSLPTFLPQHVRVGSSL